MRKINSRIARICLLLITSCYCLPSHGQNSSPVTYFPETPVVGQTLNVRYDNSATALSIENTINGAVYFWRGLHWEGEDLALEEKDGAWETGFSIPADCALFAIRFYASGNPGDVAQDTYVSMTSKPGGGNLPTCYLGWGMLHNESLMSYPGLVGKDAYIDDEAMRSWIEKERECFPGSFPYLFYYDFRLMHKMFPGVYNDKIAEGLRSLLGMEDLDETTLGRAREIAGCILQDTEMAAAIEERIMSEYPDGVLVRDKEIIRISAIADMDGKEREFAEFVQKFPYDKFKNASPETDRQLRNLLRSIIYNPVLDNRDYTALYKYTSQAPHYFLATYFWHLVQIPYNNGERTAAQIRPVADFLYGELFSRPRAGNDRRFSPREWDNMMTGQNREAVMTYASILNETGMEKEALALAERIRDGYAFKSSGFNDLYVRILQNNGCGPQVIPVIKASLREDAVTPAMLNILEADYIASNGSAKGYDEYVNSMKSAEKIRDMQQHLLQSLIDEDIKLFALEGPGGVRVDMSDLKDKIIVLDFWATWCGPCKAAMPGMQMAVDKYKDDPDVVFYFIATMETKKDYREQIDRFMAGMGYNMNVLYDNVNPETGAKDQVYSAYSRQIGSSGIPLKMIIDGNGKLRWASNGYMGSPSALVEELSFLIETMKAQ